MLRSWLNPLMWNHIRGANHLFHRRSSHMRKCNHLLFNNCNMGNFDAVAHKDIDNLLDSLMHIGVIMSVGYNHH